MPQRINVIVYLQRYGTRRLVYAFKLDGLTYIFFPFLIIDFFSETKLPIKSIIDTTKLP